MKQFKNFLFITSFENKFLLFRNFILSKFNIQNINENVKLDYIKLIVKIDDLENLIDIKILDSLFLLEKITGQKAYISMVKMGFYKVDEIYLVSEVKLRKKNSINFLNYFLIFFAEIIKVKKLFYNVQMKDDKIIINLRDFKGFLHIEDKSLSTFNNIVVEIKMKTKMPLNSNYKNNIKLYLYYFFNFFLYNLKKGN